MLCVDQLHVHIYTLLALLIHTNKRLFTTDKYPYVYTLVRECNLLPALIYCTLDDRT